jgi:hypothetical protein
VLGPWDVFLCVAAHQDALKRSGVELSWKLPCVRVGLFISGRLAPSPSSLAATQSA